MEFNLEDRKCGFRIYNDVRSNLDLFTPEQQVILKSLVTRPQLQTSIVSPSGFFRVHYDLTGNNRPSYTAGTVEQNVAQVAEALDSTYRFEIGYLGFLSPPGDNGAGSDDKYDVYIQDLNGVYYGYTEWETKVGVVNWTSFMVIDNDYLDKDALGRPLYYTEGIDGALVTVAHEFHHGIQVGSYSLPNDNSPYRDEDVFFYELTSTSMEEFVFDTVNDYYGYLRSYFQSPNKPFAGQNGYNMAIWNLYLQKRFGFQILKNQWELIPSINAILAINNTILDNGSYFPGELNKFGIWTYYTNIRTGLGPDDYFEEAANYPLITPTSKLTFNPPQQNAQGTLRPTANYFLKFTIGSTGDSLYAIITNGDAFAASTNWNQFFSFDYTLFSDTSSGSRKLTHDYSSTFNSNSSYWSVSEIFNNILVREDSTQFIPEDTNGESFVFPNPFFYSNSTGSETIFIAFDTQLNEDINFSVFSAGLELVYSSNNLKTSQISTADGKNFFGINWNIKKEVNHKLDSGVYIYVIKQGDEVIKGKVVIFDE